MTSKLIPVVKPNTGFSSTFLLAAIDWAISDPSGFNVR